MDIHGQLNLQVHCICIGYGCCSESGCLTDIQTIYSTLYVGRANTGNLKCFDSMQLFCSLRQVEADWIIQYLKWWLFFRWQQFIISKSGQFVYEYDAIEIVIWWKKWGLTFHFSENAWLAIQTSGNLNVNFVDISVILKTAWMINPSFVDIECVNWRDIWLIKWMSKTVDCNQ